MSARYSYCLQYNRAHQKCVWYVFQGDLFDFKKAKVFLEFLHPEGYSDDEPPEPVRKEYERLIGWTPESVSAAPVNIVEAFAGDDCAFDQPCVYGHRVEQHAVYCHNQTWLYAPRKCRRSRHRPDYLHKDCKGFSPNPKVAE